MFNKKTFIEFVLVALATMIVCKCGFAEDVTITTYYPAPFGVYEELRAKKIGIGTTYMDTTTVNVADNNLIVEGNVGIGTDTPSRLLDLKQNDYRLIEFDRTVNANVNNLFYIGPSWGGGVDHLGFHTNGAGGNNMMVIKSNGDVGIGTTSPSQKLDVNGVIRTRPRASATCDASAEGGIYYDSDDNHFYGCDGTAWVQIDGAGAAVYQ